LQYDFGYVTFFTHRRRGLSIIRIKDYHCFLELFFGKDEKCKKEELGFKILKE